LVRKANAVKEETKWATWLYHQRNKSIHVTDGVTMTSLSASLLQKIHAAMDRLCQILLNWKLSCKLEKWCNFSSSVKAKSCKKQLHKSRPASLFIKEGVGPEISFYHSFSELVKRVLQKITYHVY
jgi:hypothetical protein